MADILTRGTVGTQQMPINEVARHLLERFGPTFVAYIAGARNRSLPAKWATEPASGGLAPTGGEAQRLRLAHEAFTLIADADNEHVARAWMIARNVRFATGTPADQIRDYNAAAVRAAARAFIADDYYA